MNKPFTSAQVKSMPIGYTQTAKGNRSLHRQPLQSRSPIYGYQLDYVQRIEEKDGSVKLIPHAVFRKKV